MAARRNDQGEAPGNEPTEQPRGRIIAPQRCYLGTH